MIATGLTITAFAGLAIFVIGTLYIIIPLRMASNFGIPTFPDPDAAPWLRLKGIRDCAIGVTAAVLLLTAPSDVVGWVVLAFVIVPFGDALTVLFTGGPKWAVFGVHGATAIAMGVAAALLLL